MTFTITSFGRVPGFVCGSVRDIRACRVLDDFVPTFDTGRGGAL